METKRVPFGFAGAGSSGDMILGEPESTGDGEDPARALKPSLGEDHDSEGIGMKLVNV